MPVPWYVGGKRYFTIILANINKRHSILILLLLVTEAFKTFGNLRISMNSSCPNWEPLELGFRIWHHVLNGSSLIPSDAFTSRMHDLCHKSWPHCHFHNSLHCNSCDRVRVCPVWECSWQLCELENCVTYVTANLMSGQSYFLKRKNLPLIFTVGCLNPWVRQICRKEMRRIRKVGTSPL